ncbi:AMP-dependent synthetase [Pandoraea terrae]|uniref:AMP-dependent synthetase n=1 Tax=Pandoraea terrae TaxID=1537710 RepID=A0A5E4X4L3_9BURK|nr:AMP-binding protein [Pandoraea terrae]VVE31182.1 AMP-dependent synthetase [Pandoraea terrae]
MPQILGFEAARDMLIAQRDQYEVAYRDFRWPVLSEFNWALDFFDEEAIDNSALALWVVEEDGRETRLTFAEMSDRSNRVANFLRAHGVVRGDRVLLMLPNQVELWDLMLACIKLGAVMIPATTLLAPADLADRLGRGRVGHVVTTAVDAVKFDAIPGQYSRIVAGGTRKGWSPLAAAYDLAGSDLFVPDGRTLATDPLLLYFTSGTTSRPKLVLHTHQSYPVGHLATMYWLGLQPGDVHWNISSPGWAKHAWSCFFAPWNAGAAVFVHNVARFDARTALETAARCGVTALCAPPTVWRMMIQEDLARYPVQFRELIGAGEPLNPEVIDKVRRAWGITIRDGYGQTETCCQIGNPPGQTVKPGAMGRPMPGYRVALLDQDGNETDEGEVALVLASRPTGLMQRYEDDPETTADVMRGGYYRTGDVAMRDERGYYTYVGRTDDVFKASDYRISPFELESELIKHPAVAEAGVVPSPDPIRLAVPKAFITLRSGFAADSGLALDILRFCKDNLAPYKRVRRIEFCELPKTISGKIRRVELRRTEEARSLESRRPNEYWDADFPEMS